MPKHATQRSRSTTLPLIVLTLLTVGDATRGEAQDAPDFKTASHALLKKDVGVWDVKGTISMAPGTPALEITAMETNTLGESGLWLLSKFDGKIATTPFQGHGQVGFDPHKKKYVGTWVDNMTPSLTIMEGDYDAKTKTLTMVNSGTNPVTGAEQNMKTVTVYKSDDEKTMTFHALGPDGKPVAKIMELIYTRRK